MSDYDTAGATAALTQALSSSAPAPETASAPVEQAPAAVPQQGQERVDVGATPEQGDTFTNVDPNTLPPELQAIYKSMQGDYTRKNQELAEFRRGIDELGGIDQARAAVQFATALNSDPDFAMQVHRQLTQSLTDAGLSPAQAQAEATRQVQDAAQQVDDFGEEDPLSPLQRELNELKQWKQSVESERQEHFLANELNRQETLIRQQHPHYTDTDFADIYNLSFRTDGNLIAAADMYQSMRDRMIASYMEEKSRAPETVPATGVPHTAQQPHSFDTLEDAGKAARERLRAMGVL